MTFKRDFLMQTAAPQIVITAVLLLVFTFFGTLPPQFTFCYGISVIVIDIILLIKGVLAKNTSDFEYTISYDDRYLKIELASGETHTYNRKTLKANKNALFFWIKDGKQQHIYPYNDKVIAFLDQLE